MRTALLPVLLIALPACNPAADAVTAAACQATGYTSEGSVSARAGDARFSAICVRAGVDADVLTVSGIENVVSEGRQRSIALAVDSEPGTYAVRADGVMATYIARADDPDRQP